MPDAVAEIIRTLFPPSVDGNWLGFATVEIKPFLILSPRVIIRSKNPAREGRTLRASVIICTFNRAYLLERVLRSLADQTLRLDSFEVIVVDDGSKDHTPSICQQLRANLPNLKHLTIACNKGAAYARNVGIQEASSECLLFTDDDCIPEKEWVERLSAALEDEPIVGGAVASSAASYLKLCHNISQFHACMLGQRSKKQELIAGANMGLRRSVLKELDGFTPSFRIAQDMELILRARQKGYAVRFVPEAVVIHDPAPFNLREIFRYACEHASVTILLRNRYRSLLKTPGILCSPLLIWIFSPFIALRVTWNIYLGNLNLVKRFWTVPLVFALKLAWCWGAAPGLKAQSSSWKRMAGMEKGGA